MVFNRYFSLCGEPYFQLLRELFLSFLALKIANGIRLRYQISGTHFASNPRRTIATTATQKGLLILPGDDAGERSRELNGETDYWLSVL